MAREFTRKEIKAVILQHQEMLQKLHAVSIFAGDLASNTKKLMVDPSALQSFDLRIQHELEDGRHDDLISPVEMTLLKNVYLYHATKTFSDHAKQLIDYYGQTIRNNINVLEDGIRAINWLFLSNTKKKAIETSMSYLQGLLNDSYASNFTNVVQTVRNFQSVTDNQIVNEVKANTKVYLETLRSMVSKPAQNGKIVSTIKRIDDRFTEFGSEMIKVEALIQENKSVIEQSVNKLAARETLDVLKEIPVEELNRDKQGIKVKSLRDYGYTSIADIVSASVYHIYSVYGISEDSAYLIKNIANQMAEQAQENIKIRISADNKTSEATSLLGAIYQYREKTDIYKNAENTLNHDAGERQKKLDNLHLIGNGVEWLLLPVASIQKLKDQYKDVLATLNGPFKDALVQLHSGSSKYIVSEDTVWADFQKDPIPYYNIIEQITPGMLGNSDSLYGLPEDLAREIQEEAFFPNGLLCTLRRYQEWGVKYALHQERVLLGDEMGLGKTIQAIATMVSLRNTGGTHFLVICPASVVTNWCREIKKHSRLSATKIHGVGRRSAMKSWMKTGGVAVTTYETTGLFSELGEYQFDLLVVDEAHYVKNPGAQRTINVKEIASHTKRMLFMTGTALENKVEEMVSLIDILQPDIAKRAAAISFMSQAQQFRECVAPVYYRRKREDVLTELPDLIDSKEWCSMTPEETDEYEANILNKNAMAARRVSWDIPNLANSSKAKRLLEIIEEAENEDRKVIVFSFFLDTIRRIGMLLGSRAVGVINGSVPVARRQEIIDNFDKAKSGAVLLAQIQSGGTGLNIQSASVVVICEPQVKPSIENQAISRAYRMGQARNVLVYHLLCENSIDERIVDMLERKQAIFDAFADKSVAAEESIAIDAKTLGNIIQEEIDRINGKASSPIIGSSTVTEIKEEAPESLLTEENEKKGFDNRSGLAWIEHFSTDAQQRGKEERTDFLASQEAIKSDEELYSVESLVHNTTVPIRSNVSAVTNNPTRNIGENTQRSSKSLDEYIQNHILCTNCHHAMQLAKGSRSGKTFLRCPSCNKTELLDYHFVNQYIRENNVVCPEHGTALRAGVSRYGLYVRCREGHFISPEKI